MSAAEKRTFDAIKEAHPQSRLWHIDNGTAYAADRRNVVKTTKGLLLKAWRVIRYGFEKGSGDFIGWTPVKITPDMVGDTVAIFTSIEGKSENDSIKPEQIEWARKVRRAGGIAKIIWYRGGKLFEEPIE